MIIFTYFIWQMISHLNQIYLCGYHFIKMLDRPVDLPLRFIIVCVAEPLTFKREMDIMNKDLKGISVGNEEHVIGLYADDVICYLEDTDTCLPILTNQFEMFGFYLNLAKTPI